MSRRSLISIRLPDRLPTFAARPLFRDLVVLLVVAVASLLVLRGPSVNQGFTIDESRWIATSRYFWITFVDRDLFGSAWQPNYLVYTHPPVARYLIGFGLWLQGWSPDQLNGRYDSLQNRAYNERAGNVPDLDLLWAARRVTLAFAVTSVVLVYIVGRILGGIWAGLVAAAFALVNPLLTTVWTRALAESIVAAFCLLALALALQAMPRARILAARGWVPLAVGTAIALAAASKLNGALGAIGMGAFVVLQQAQALLRTRRTIGLRYWFDVGLSATIVFVAVNPLLYVDPADRIIGLVQHRQAEMQLQRSVFTVQAVPDDLQARVERVVRRVFDTYATRRGSTPISVDTVLVPIGLIALGWRSMVELRGGETGPASLFLCWLAATYAIVTTNLGFDSSHYFAPLVTLNVLTMGFAAVAMAAMIRRLVGRLNWRGPQDLDQNVQAPTT